MAMKKAKTTKKSGTAKASTTTRPTKAAHKAIRVLVLHGPNLNLLGEREPEIYGSLTLNEINSRIRAFGKSHGCEFKIHQSNGEGVLIDFIHKYRKWADAIVINPGAYTHYSYALRDALASVALDAYEVHLSDIHSREPFRRVSVIAEVCREQISGLGWQSYIRALEKVVQIKQAGSGV